MTSGTAFAQIVVGGSFMGRDSNLFKTILVPVDFSPCSDEAFQVACQMARLCGAAMLILHVIDTSTLAAFNRLGLLAVPSDAAPQRRRLRHHARLKSGSCWSRGRPNGKGHSHDCGRGAIR
ncbi:MAG: universal stress protein [Nitrospira sp.]|nr:universal stress protein [Nitrospira sp.]